MNLTPNDHKAQENNCRFISIISYITLNAFCTVLSIRYCFVRSFDFKLVVFCQIK